MTFKGEIRSAERDVEWFTVATNEIPYYWSSWYGYIQQVAISHGPLRPLAGICVIRESPPARVAAS